MYSVTIQCVNVCKHSSSRVLVSSDNINALVTLIVLAAVKIAAAAHVAHVSARHNFA
jgi:hypothetical protein